MRSESDRIVRVAIEEPEIFGFSCSRVYYTPMGDAMDVQEVASIRDAVSYMVLYKMCPLMVTVFVR
ncbi:MAG: hypothetical protein JW945_02965 [Methanomicrobia archaeon]|nr:hypothetical protein [Methanomicrobia archaeon]